MTHQEPALKPEAVLELWLRESDRERARELLECLISRHADPLIRRIISFKLFKAGDTGGVQRADVDDVCATALCNLMGRLVRLKSSGKPAAFRNLGGYVATIAYNACNEYFRAKKPAWLSLSMKLRYMATHAPQFSLWESREGQEWCGFTLARGQPGVTDLARLAGESRKLRQSQDPSRMRLAELVEVILKTAGGPLRFEDLVDVTAEWAGLKEARSQSIDAGAGEGGNQWDVPDCRPAADVVMIDRYYMNRLWNEICNLPLPHRKALLLNLNDSAGGDIQLFDHLGIATVEQIAKVLEMEPRQFAEFWKDLPLDDARIGRDLGISRQDVANRRSAARKMLARRMKEFKGGN